MKLDLEEREPGTLEVFFSSHPLIVVDAKLFKKSLQTFDVGSVDEFWQKFSQLEYTLARTFALKLVAQRSMHSKMLEKKLLDRRFSKKSIERVQESFQESGYLQDEAWLARFAEQEGKRGKSFPQILLKAKSLGIASCEIQPYLTEQGSVLEAFIQKKFPKLLERKIEPLLKQKMIVKLLRRGFSFAEVQKALNNLIK